MWQPGHLGTCPSVLTLELECALIRQAIFKLLLKISKLKQQVRRWLPPASPQALRTRSHIGYRVLLSTERLSW